MNLDDAATLVAETRAMYPGMSIVPGIVDAWHKVLAPFDLDDCRMALTRYGSLETRIPVPADVRRLCSSARQDTAMRALPSGRDGQLVTKPDWFDTTAAYHKEQTRVANAERKERGEPPFYGVTVKKPSDGRLGR